LKSVSDFRLRLDPVRFFGFFASAPDPAQQISAIIASFRPLLILGKDIAFLSVDAKSAIAGKGRTVFKRSKFGLLPLCAA